MKQMKDSGIEWIGEIPEDWELIKIGSIFRCRNEKVNDTDYPPLSVTRNGIIPQIENVAKTDANDNRKMVKVNDFVINSRSDRKQSCGVSILDGSVSLINTVLYTENTDVILPEYTNLLMKNYGFAEEFYRWGHGIVADLWTTRWQEMKSIVLPLPNTQQQEKIVRFVQKKVCGIDNLIAHEQAMIEELKAYKQSVITEAVTKGLDKSVPVKDSGVEWMGEVPESWCVLATKRLFLVVSGATPKSDKSEFWDGNIKWITPADYKTEDIYINGGKRSITEAGLKSCNTTMIPPNNIIFSKRAPIGAVAINNSELCTNQGCLACIAKEDLAVKYFYYVMSVFTEQYEFLGTGTTFKEISLNVFKDFLLPYPHIQEQIQIADYLDKECANIDSLITIKQQKIEELKEYKKSLIYEYVTGKKEVI